MFFILYTTTHDLHPDVSGPMGGLQVYFAKISITELYDLNPQWPHHGSTAAVKLIECSDLPSTLCGQQSSINHLNQQKGVVDTGLQAT